MIAFFKSFIPKTEKSREKKRVNDALAAQRDALRAQVARLEEIAGRKKETGDGH